MIARRSYGGDLYTQTGIYLLSIITLSAASMAYYNIKRLQIDQHRNWMLRAMCYVNNPLETLSFELLERKSANSLINIIDV